MTYFLSFYANTYNKKVKIIKEKKMATKSPGIYFTENDFTQYTNPKATEGTTVAIVGYAQKGPISEPVLITNWADYVKKFGKGVNGYYSTMAVKNVLTAGGAVLFTRVADSTASNSGYVIKNAIEPTNGKTLFAKETDVLVGTKDYSNKSIYSLKVSNGNESKIFLIRSPASGKLTQASILKQLIDQNVKTSSYWEKQVLGLSDGLFGFNVKIGDDLLGGDYGFYLETKSSWNLNTFTSALVTAISSGCNAIHVLNLENTSTGQSGTYLDPTEVLKFSGVKKFAISLNGTSYKVNINVPENTTLESLTSILDSALKSSYGVRVVLDKGSNVAGKVEQPKLLFIYKQKEVGNSIYLTKYSATPELTVKDNEIVGTTELFSAVTDGEADNFNLADEIGEFTLKVWSTVSVDNSENKYTDLTISGNEDTSSVIFTLKDTKDEKIQVVGDGVLTQYLFDSITGIEIGSINSQDKLNIDIYRDSKTKQITFESANDISCPALLNVSAQDLGMESLPAIFKDLLSITVTEKNEDGFVSREGNVAVDSSTQDMVAIFARTKGRVDNISVEVYTSTSPITGIEKHDIIVKEDNSVVETYEDVSFNYADVENRFDTMINKEPENGGSSFITINVVKNNFDLDDVQVPNGVYHLGKSNKAEDVKKDPDVSVTSYNLYDYVLGGNGVPAENSSELFTEALHETKSLLSNKDLYDFHILICPDNISQEVQAAQITLCETRKDAMTIIDPPIGLDKDAVIQWHNGRGYGRSEAPQSNYAATYWPWCKVYDNSTGEGKYIWVMPSVIMASKYVAVDKSFGPQYAPAGETNGVISAVDIETSPSLLDRDELYVDYNRINPFVKFKDGSIICYGEKTLQRTNSVLTKVHTRRMLVQIKKQCREALKGYIFMPNETSYLEKINANISAILERYKARGGLQAYKVIVDETNNPVESRQRDVINVQVALVPNGTIETVNIDLNLFKNEEAITDSEK